MKTLAIIPARGGSKRLPGKNVRPFAGVPLIGWSIRFARRFARFDHVLVSTDDAAIAEACRLEGLPVDWLRPAHLAEDTSPTLDVVLDALAREAKAGRSYDTVALLQPTSPMRLIERWQAAFELLDTGACEAVVGVGAAKTHPFHTFRFHPDGRLDPFLGRGGLQLRGQDLPHAVAVAGNLYLIREAALRRERSFFPQNVRAVLCDLPFETIDIDTPLDWLVAETLAVEYGVKP